MEIVDIRSGASRLPSRSEEIKARYVVIRRELNEGILRYELIGVYPREGWSTFIR